MIWSFLLVCNFLFKYIFLTLLQLERTLTDFFFWFMIEFNLIAQGRQLMYEEHLLMQSFLITLRTWRILTLYIKVTHLGNRNYKKAPQYLQKELTLLFTQRKLSKKAKQVRLEAGPKGFPLGWQCGVWNLNPELGQTLCGPLAPQAALMGCIGHVKATDLC